MNARRRLFYDTIRRWWNAAFRHYDWTTPNTPEMLAFEDELWEMKERFEGGQCTLAQIRPAFDRWLKSHQKALLPEK